MRATPAATRVLVASDNLEDARQVVRQLSDWFENVRVSTTLDSALEDFRSFEPNVLVLAFDTLDKAQGYYLGLFRLGAASAMGAHRTIVLCSKDEVRAAFELCRKDCFDDYVQHWPQSYDGVRLAMSVWNAGRHATTGNGAPDNAALRLHARHLAELERVVADPVHESLPSLIQSIEPALAQTRPLAEALRALKPMVMVIDDDEFSRSLVQRSLDLQRWQVVMASDAPSSLAQLRRVRPDVILMDVRLPGIDGLALTRQLKASPHLASIPVVMMTGDSRRETLVSSMEAGAVAFVVKPVSRSALDAKLDKVVPR
jgi:CheY-like chemotaxis protein